MFFRWLIYTFQAGFFSGGKSLLGWMGPYYVVVLPAVGGYFVGLIVRKMAPEAKGHGVPEVMLAIARAGRPHPAAGGAGQDGGLRALHRQRRLGRARGTHRADRLRARLLAGPVAEAAGKLVAHAGGLRRGGRHLGHVQRAAGRLPVRHGGGDGQVRHGQLRAGGGQLGGRRPGRPGLPRPLPGLLRRQHAVLHRRARDVLLHCAGRALRAGGAAVHAFHRLVGGPVREEAARAGVEQARRRRPRGRRGRPLLAGPAGRRLRPHGLAEPRQHRQRPGRHHPAADAAVPGAAEDRGHFHDHRQRRQRRHLRPQPVPGGHDGQRRGPGRR